MDSILHRWLWRMLTAALVVAAVCVGTAPVYAQAPPSLADLARQEAERRKAIKAPSKVVTEKDLKPAPPGLVPAGPGTAGAAAAAPVPEEAPAAENQTGGEQHDQAWWKARMDQLREDIRRNEIFADTLQSKINALTTEFVNRDDPYQQAKIGEQRRSMLAEMDRVKSDIERSKKAITDLEEEARRAGVPPGWLR